MSSQPPGHPEEGAHSSPSDDLSQRAYLANLRHELRTPINAIIGYAEMLLEDSGAPGAASSALAEGLNEVLAAGNRLLAVVNEVLDPDKIETGPVDVEKFQAGLRAELRDPVNNILRTGERLRGQASDLGDEDAASDLMKIQSAAESFRLMIEDLVKYSLAQPGEAPPDGSDGQAAAMIEDVVGTLRELDQEQAAAGPGEGTGSLLVVDDNAINRDVLQRRVERQGHGVSVAENGRRALQMLAAQKFDLVLLDVIMPEMNGYQVLQAMKNDTALRDIPVIMISALDEMDSVVRAIEMGAEDYLTKPFNPVLLRARIGASLEKKRLRDKEVEYLQQAARVTAAAAAVEANSFEPASLDEVAHRTDQLGQLARVFQRMAREVYAREQRLKQQVQELRIQVDETRKEREVAEITESEYFQQLKQKARKLRKG